jgi:hypothetical protein
MKSFIGSVVLLLGTAAQAEIAPNDPLPTHILTCGGSVIAEIGPRLEGDTDFGSGTSVFFKNGGTQVSYEKIEAS